MFVVLLFSGNHSGWKLYLMQLFWCLYLPICTLSTHAPEAYRTRHVCLSVCHSDFGGSFRYELAQNDGLGPFIVLLSFNFGLVLRRREVISSM